VTIMQQSFVWSSPNTSPPRMGIMRKLWPRHFGRRAMTSNVVSRRLPNQSSARSNIRRCDWHARSAAFARRTDANGPYRMKSQAEFWEAVSEDVAAVRCHWQRPEAYPAREQAVGRWILQSAECGGSALCDPLSLAGQGPFRSSSATIPTFPRLGPSDENNSETQSGS
jgi:hypothetical protein